MQPMPEDGKGMKDMTKHAYVAVTPTVNFKVRGADANSASQIRKLYQNGNEADREQIIADLYGDIDAGIKDIFDRKLQARPVQTIKENRARIAEKINQLRERISQLKEFAPSPDRDDNDDVPEPIFVLANRWWNAADKQPQIESVLNSMGWSIQQVESEDDAVQLQHRDGTVYFISADDFDPDLFENLDYIEEKWSQKYKSSINCSNPKGFSQRAHCAGRKKKVNESSGYSLSGSFTPDLIRSKVWLLSELSQIAPELDTVYVLGSWYGNLALYMHLQPTVKYNQIINVETDQAMLDQSQRMLDHVGAERMDYMLKDANELDYRQLGDQGAVINTSLTDMPGTAWFEHIPAGTLVVMQARDQDPGEQYNSVQAIIDRFPLNQVYYTGTLDLQDPETEYQRFMVIGRK